MTRAPTFLILDDDEDNRVLARHALLRAFPNAHVVESADPAAALLAVADLSLDGIVTDHHLSTSDGAIFIRQIREKGIGCPVIMVTSSVDPQVSRRAYEAGADRVFAGNDFNYVGYLKTALEESPR